MPQLIHAAANPPFATYFGGFTRKNFFLAKATISELANLITAQAVTKLHELGFKFDLTPPALFAGEKMEIAALGGQTDSVEALIVPLITECGKVEINVAIRERM